MQLVSGWDLPDRIWSVLKLAPLKLGVEMESMTKLD
jgi:hypothetical protein